MFVLERRENDEVILVLVPRAFAYTIPMGNGNLHCPVKEKKNTPPHLQFTLSFIPRDGERPGLNLPCYCGS